MNRGAWATNPASFPEALSRKANSMSGYDTSPSGINQAEAKGDTTVRQAKAGNPKGSAGTHSDAPEKPYVGQPSIARNEENKPAPARPLARSTVPNQDAAKRGPVKPSPRNTNTYRTARG